MRNKPILIWLLTGCALIFAMVVIGGITRLTGSGLSITEWKPIMGTLPPLNETQWNEAFSKYRESPQFQKVNFDFTISEFKSIFWWEYLHRLIGRMIGIVFLIPFVFFLVRKQLNKKLIRQSIFIFLLGGLQGLLGWFMVKSGLIDDPHVSHYRLAAHLITAFTSFGFTFWVALELKYEQNMDKLQKSVDKIFIASIKKPILFFFGLVILQIIYGAFVAGLHAGKIYNTFPLMDGSIMPDSVTSMKPFPINFLENLAGVQFIHRMLAFSLVITGLWIVYRIRKNNAKILLRPGNLLISVLLFQFSLGILTLLYAVPVWLGVLHQSGAFFLFASSIYLYHKVTRARQV